MDMNIDVKATQDDIRKIYSFANRIEDEIISLRLSLSSAALGFQSKHYESVEDAVNQSIAATNNMIDNLETVQNFVNELIDLTESYLNLKY